METFVDELELLKASFSNNEIEFFVSSKSPLLKFCLNADSSITFEIPDSYPILIPSISLTSKDITKSRRCELENEIRDFASTLIGNPMIMEIVNKAKELIEVKNEIKDITNSPSVTKQDNYFAAITIDHMRQKQRYSKTLIAWASELNISGVLLFCLKKIFLILESNKHNVKEFVIRLRTATVDVDSSGRPCKEKMSTILYEGELFDTKMFSSFSVEEFPTLKEMKSYFIDKDLLKIYDILKDS